MSYPTTYDYDYTEQFELHPNYNLFSFKLVGGDMTQEEINANLRVTFVDSLLGDHIPSMYCDMMFSEQIAAELSGESDSNFFTKTYGIGLGQRWICPYIK